MFSDPTWNHFGSQRTFSEGKRVSTESFVKLQRSSDPRRQGQATRHKAAPSIKGEYRAANLGPIRLRQPSVTANQIAKDGIRRLL
jgi:hypothetical protein